MREYGFSLTRILPYKDRICSSVFIRENKVSENHYSHIFYAVGDLKNDLLYGVMFLNKAVIVPLFYCPFPEISRGS